MSYGTWNMTELAPGVALGMVGLAMLLAFVRLVRGPTLPDRVVALDLMGVLAVGMLAAYAVAADQPVLLDPAAGRGHPAGSESLRAPLAAESYVCPGVVAIPLDARTDAEITLLANLITLTPGSVSLDLSEDKRVLYVHAMYIDGGDVEAYRRSVKEGLERRVLELLR